MLLATTMTSHQPPSPTTNKFNERLDVDFALQATQLGVWEIDLALPVDNFPDLRSE
ncbi:hypothetical protein [Spirosoma horti]